MKEYKFTSSPWGFRFWEFERYCDFMKKIGINELCSMFAGNEKLPLSFEREEEKIKRYKEIADKKGVKIIEISYAGDWQKEIPLLKILGVKYYRVCTIWEKNEETFKKVVEELKNMGKLAKEYDIEIVVENHGGLLTEAGMCRRLMESVNMENVKINYDPANFLYYGEDPIKAIDEIKNYIGFTHFKSVKYENGKKKYCKLKEGIIDYKKIFEKLLTDYNGYLGLEYEEAKDVEEGTIDDFEYIKGILNEKGK